MIRRRTSAQANRYRHARGGGAHGDLSARLVALHQAAAKLASDTSVTDVTNDTLDAMKHALGFDHADFMMVENGRLIAKEHRGKKSRYPTMELTGPGIIVKAAKRRKALLVPETRLEPDYLEGWKGVRSELAVPVVLDGETVGVLNVESAKLNSFTKDDQELLETLASHVSSCMGRLRDERSLRQSEARMRGILNALPDLVFEMDSKGVYRDYYASDRNDLAARPEAFIGKRMRDVLPPQVAGPVEDAMAKARKNEGAVVIEYQLPTLRGAIREWEAHISRTGGGGCILIARDITRRKRAEERLRQSEVQYRSLIDRMLDGTYRTTHEGKVVDVNPAFVKMFGYSSKQEMLGIADIGKALYFSPEDRESQFLDTGLQRTEVFKMRRKDGSAIWVEDHGRYVHDRQGRVIFHEGVLRDVTERVNAEEALRESEERYRDLVEGSPDGVMVGDAGRIFYINPTAAKILGVEDTSKVLGIGWMAFIHPDSIKAAAEQAGHLINDKESITLEEAKFIRHDGTPIDVEIAAIPVSWHGTPALEVVFHDITERKRMASELRQYSDHLEELVAARTEELKEAERMAAMGQFAAMVAHDLRNPLTGIAGAAYYLRKKYGQAPDEVTREMLDVIEKDVEYSNQMMTSLVEYSGEMRLNLVETGLQTIVRKALGMVRIPAGVRVFDSTKNEPRMMLDEEKMVRVSVNVVQNAVEAMPQGGEIAIESKESEGRMQLCFSDTGAGMSKERLEKIWIPFSTTKAKGMGLGLPLSKQVVEAHGGSISVSSEVGRGTTVTIILPLGGAEGGANK